MNRAFIAGGAALAAFGIAGGAYLASGQDSDGFSQVSESSQSIDFAEQLPITDVTQAEILNQAEEVFGQYENLFGVELNKEEIRSSISLVPNVSKMTPEEYAKYCYPQENCSGFMATTMDDRQIFIFKDAFDGSLKGLRNSKKNQTIKEDLIRDTVAHEITHFIAKKVPISDELFALTIKYLGNSNVGVDPSKLRKRNVNGAIIELGIEGDTTYVQYFRGVEEAESIVIAQYLVQHQERPSVLPYDNPSFNDYYPVETTMLNQLLRKFDGGMADGIIQIAQLRPKENGREEICKLIGRQLGADEQSAMEYGFQVLVAINTKNYDKFKQLVGN